MTPRIFPRPAVRRRATLLAVLAAPFALVGADWGQWRARRALRDPRGYAAIGLPAYRALLELQILVDPSDPSAAHAYVLRRLERDLGPDRAIMAVMGDSAIVRTFDARGRWCEARGRWSHPHGMALVCDGAPWAPPHPVLAAGGSVTGAPKARYEHLPGALAVGTQLCRLSTRWPFC